MTAVTRNTIAYALVVAALAGCGSTGEDPVNPESNITDHAPCEAPTPLVDDDRLHLDTHFDADENRVVVRYEVRNDRPEPVYIANRLPRNFEAGSDRTPTQRYYLVPRHDGVLEISKRAYRPTDDCPIDFAQPIKPPSFTLVPPGSTYQDEFTVSRPFRIEHPYGELTAPDLTPIPDPPHTIIFCLGVATPKTPDPAPRQVEGETLYDARDFDLSGQQHLCSEPHAL